MKNDMKKLMKETNRNYLSLLEAANRPKRTQFGSDILRDFLIAYPSTNKYMEVLTIRKTMTFIYSLIPTPKETITTTDVTTSVSQAENTTRAPKVRDVTTQPKNVRSKPKKIAKVKAPLDPEAVERRRIREARDADALKLQTDNDNNQIFQSEALNNEAKGSIASLPFEFPFFLSFQKIYLINLVQKLTAHQHKLMAIKIPNLMSSRLLLANNINDTVTEIKSNASFILAKSWREEENDETLMNEKEIAESLIIKKNYNLSDANKRFHKGAYDSAIALDKSLHKAVTQHQNYVKGEEIVSETDINHRNEVRDSPDVFYTALEIVKKEIRLSVKESIDDGDFNYVAGYSFLTGPKSSQFHSSEFSYNQHPLVNKVLKSIVSEAYPPSVFKKRKIQQTSLGNDTAYNFITSAGSSSTSS